MPVITSEVFCANLFYHFCNKHSGLYQQENNQFRFILCHVPARSENVTSFKKMKHTCPYCNWDFFIVLNDVNVFFCSKAFMVFDECEIFGAFLIDFRKKHLKKEEILRLMVDFVRRFGLLD